MPALRAGQRAVLVLGQDEYLPQGSRLAGAVARVRDPERAGRLAPGARLRIDDIESPIIDLSQEPPVTPTFLNQRVVIS